MRQSVARALSATMKPPRIITKDKPRKTALANRNRYPDKLLLFPCFIKKIYFFPTWVTRDAASRKASVADRRPTFTSSIISMNIFSMASESD